MALVCCVQAKHLIFHAFRDQANKELSTQAVALHMLQVAQVPHHTLVYTQ